MFGKRSDVGATPPPVLPVPQPASPNGDAFAGGAAPTSHIPDLDVSCGRRECSGQEPAPFKNVQPAAAKAPNPILATARKSESYYDIKSTIFNALIDAIDLTQLGQLDRDAARDEIRDIVNEIITLKDVVMSIAEQEELLEDICNDVLGYGPLEPLLARDDISDIMGTAPI